MISRVYHNSTTQSGASIHINGDEEKRKIIVDVTVHDAINHTYNRNEFAAEDFAKAIDFYDKAVERFKEQERELVDQNKGSPTAACDQEENQSAG